MARGKRTSDQVRAQVMAHLLAGMSVSETATATGVPHQTVSDLRRSVPVHLLSGALEARRETLETQTLRYLGESLRALTSQLEVLASPSYLRSHGASDLALLHGVIADKGFRLLAALEPPAEDASFGQAQST